MTQSSKKLEDGPSRSESLVSGVVGDAAEEFEDDEDDDDDDEDKNKTPRTGVIDPVSCKSAFLRIR
jgi:hypothetical protein